MMPAFLAQASGRCGLPTVAQAAAVSHLDKPVNDFERSLALAVGSFIRLKRTHALCARFYRSERCPEKVKEHLRAVLDWRDRSRAFVRDAYAQRDVLRQGD